MIKRLLFLAITGTFLLSWSPSQKIEWVAIGDSITYLNDHADETGNRVKKGYMTRVVEQLPTIRYTNKGYNGWTAGSIAEQINELAIPKADVYTIFLGTNDWWSGRPIGTIADFNDQTGPATLYGSFRIIIDKLRSLNSSAKIILITPLQRGDFVYFGNFKNNAYGSYQDKNGQSLAGFADAVKKIGHSEKLTVVDLYHKSGITQKNMVKYKYLRDSLTGDYKKYHYPEFIGQPFDPEKDEYPYPEEAIDMTYDGLHPSDKGNAVIANMLVKTMLI